MGRRKSENLNLKIHPLTLDEFRAAAMVLDNQPDNRIKITMSSLQHQSIVNTIGEVKRQYPEQFKAALLEIKQEKKEKQTTPSPVQSLPETQAMPPKETAPTAHPGVTGKPRASRTPNAKRIDQPHGERKKKA